MAHYKEVGIGITSVLASEHAPRPLPLTLKGQMLPEAARIVVAVLDECSAAGIELEKIELDPKLYAEVRSRLASDERIVSNSDLQCEVRFFRSYSGVR